MCSVKNSSKWTILEADRLQCTITKKRCPTCRQKISQSKCQNCYPDNDCIHCGNINSSHQCRYHFFCHICLLTDHCSGKCPHKYQARKICKLCGNKSHWPEICPSHWRQYHLVVSQHRPQKSFKPQHNTKSISYLQSLNNKTNIVCCYNCGYIGHEGQDCTGYRMSKFIPHVTSHIIYTTCLPPLNHEKISHRLNNNEFNNKVLVGDFGIESYPAYPEDDDTMPMNKGQKRKPVNPNNSKLKDKKRRSKLKKTSRSLNYLSDFSGIGTDDLSRSPSIKELQASHSATSNYNIHITPDTTPQTCPPPFYVRPDLDLAQEANDYNTFKRYFSSTNGANDLNQYINNNNFYDTDLNLNELTNVVDLFNSYGNNNRLTNETMSQCNYGNITNPNSYSYPHETESYNPYAPQNNLGFNVEDSTMNFQYLEESSLHPAQAPCPTTFVIPPNNVSFPVPTPSSIHLPLPLNDTPAGPSQHQNNFNNYIFKAPAYNRYPTQEFKFRQTYCPGNRANNPPYNIPNFLNNNYNNNHNNNNNNSFQTSLTDYIKELKYKATANW